MNLLKSSKLVTKLHEKAPVSFSKIDESESESYSDASFEKK